MLKLGRSPRNALLAASRRHANGVLCQPACKPGSVWRVAPPRRPFLWGADCSAPRATNPGGGEDRAGRESCLSHPCRPYSVLLPVGFAVPLPLPAARCALTAPFHPCLCGSPRAGGLFSVALSLGSPPAAVSRHRRSLEPGLSSTALDGRKASSRGSGRPAGWQGGIRGVRGAGSRGCCPAHHQNEPPPP
jgi:hypothetical protein